MPDSLTSNQQCVFRTGCVHEVRCRDAGLCMGALPNERSSSGEAYLGNDRDQLREIILDRDEEIEKLRRELTEEKRRSFQDGRITYKGFDYGVGSQWGIDSLRRAIEGNEHG